ncbi:MAG: hypothetical protein HY938_10210 [Nitrosomonadales bacterium]|nr:hypothetical protein [Nitrosomonadales bacterium]
MNITSGQKKLALGAVALVVIGGAAAYIYLDPLAEPASPVSVKPKTQSGSAKPGEKSPAATSTAKPAALGATPVAKSAEQPATIAAATTPTATPAAKPTMAAATAAAPEKSLATPVQESQSSVKLTDAIKPARAKPVSPPSADLRHCLDQPTNQEIAKCAGE